MFRIYVSSILRSPLAGFRAVGSFRGPNGYISITPIE